MKAILDFFFGGGECWRGGNISPFMILGLQCGGFAWCRWNLYPNLTCWWSELPSCATHVAPRVYVSLWQLRNLHPRFPPTLSTLSPGEQGQSHLPTQMYLSYLCHSRAWPGGLGQGRRASKYLGQDRRVEGSGSG